MSEHTDALRALRDLDDVSLTCRRGSGIGHAWRVLGWYQHGDETRRSSVCDRCGTTKTDRWVKRTGERHAPRYEHPDGYSLPEQPQAYEVRMEVMRRARVFASEEAMITALTEGAVRRSKGASK
jgi:hypothetical protein